MHLLNGLLFVLAVVFLSVVLNDQSASGADNRHKPGKSRLMYNMDYDALSGGFFGMVSPENIDKCVDYLASSGITDLFVCVNNQRVNYRSKVWDPIWLGCDMNAGADQPFMAGLLPEEAGILDQCKSFYNLDKQGISYPERMLESAHKKRIKGWISIRMNDSHYGDRSDHPYHSEFWRKHSEWYLRDGGSSGTELDYAQPEVKEHYLALIREICEGYNLDGLELDYMRFPAYFHPHQWKQGEEIMTGFVREVRSITQKASKRLKHPVKLAVRVHFLPWTAKRMGTDAAAWAKEKLVDMVVIAPWYTGIQSDMPIETWRGLLADTKTELAYCLEDGIYSRAEGRRTPTVEETTGISLAALHRGADYIYMFNWYNLKQQADYTSLYKASRTYDSLLNLPRRHPVSTIDPLTAEGESSPQFTLPAKAPRIVYSINIGPKPNSNQKAYIEMITDTTTAPSLVLLNNIECKPNTTDGNRHIFECPKDAVDEGVNLIVIESDGNMTVNWVEIAIR